MYSSLDRADLTVQMGDRKIAVQTDHREAGELDAQRHLSVVFALTRACNPRRMHLDGVRLSHMARPPEWMLEVARAAGAVVEVFDAELVPAGSPDRDRMNALADASLGAIGQQVAVAWGLPLTPDGVARAAQRTAALGLRPTDPDAEVEYWTAVVELAAFCGEVLRLMGARWALHPTADSVVPFLMQAADGVWLNVFARCERVITDGPEHGPSSFFRSPVDDEGTGPDLLKFKPSGWPQAAATRCEPLIERKLPDVDVPWVCYGRDLPSHFAFTMREADARSVAELRALAMPALAQVAVQIADVAPGIVVVHDSYYAAEKLLDREFMRSLHRRFDSALLLASVPLGGRLVVGDPGHGGDPVASFARVLAVTHGLYAEDPQHQLCRTVFAVGDGQVVGVAQASTAEDASPRKSWWKRLFG